MGTPKFAVPILKSIVNSNNKILEVYTQPPQKKNRGQKIQNSPIHDFSNKLKLPVRCPNNFDKVEIDHIKKLQPDIVIVVAYGKILPSDLLNLDEIFFVNVHASLLPKWRGAAPIQRAIMNKDHETGISIMKIIPKLDAGPILMQSKIKITEEMNQIELSDKMSKLGAKLILDTIRKIEKKEVIFKDQNEKEATYAKKINKTETKIKWDEYADRIVAKINAFHSNPGCWFELNGARIKIIKAKEIAIKGRPGTILNDKLTIACSNNAVQIIELKKEGKQKMTAEEFLRGNEMKIGHILN
tara:strand:+ start:4750 stop:5646 length:897 start_codon:yes stop_codon:yes gene_type:complete